MKKKLAVLLSVATIALVGSSAIACTPTTPQDPPPPSEDQPITGATLTDKTVTYNGNKQSITVAGAPTGSSITYTYNNVTCDGVTNAGTYVVKATISAEGYVTKTLTATLVINRAQMNATMANDTVTYDGNKHSLTVVGAPSGSSIVYTYNGIERDGVNDPASYTVVATITNPNYETKTLTATLVIEEPQQEDQEMTGVSMNGDTVTYDGNKHSLTVVGAPSGANITYTYNALPCDGVTNADTYVVVAVITAEGYKTKTLTATLVINPLPMTATTLNGNTVTYDGNKHSLSVVGAPSGATIKYTYNGEEVDGVTEVGTYSVKAVVSAPNYETKTLNATLVIEASSPSLEDMTGVSMDSDTVTYDGNKHSLTVVGAPSNATIKYTYNGEEVDGVTEVGSYNVVATISKDGYNTKTLTATLTINAPELKNFDNATLEGDTVDYNGKKHSIKVSGAPLGTDVVYSYNNVECDGVTDAGTYTVKATLTKDGYNTKVLTATLVINKLNFENVTLTGYEIEYDGNKHSVLVNGKLPDNANVKYTYNGVECDGVTDAGTYNVVATITAPNYNNLTLTATLNISAVAEDKEITNVSLKKLTVIEYDTEPHSVKVEGNLPVDAVIVYTYNGVVADSATDKGNYKIVAKITAPGYKDLTLEATLAIIDPETQLYSINYNGTIFFQNNLDKDRLYTYKNGTLTRLNKDVAQYMISDGTYMYYYSNSMFSKVIKSVSGTSVSSLASVKGEWLTTDGTYIYYAINNLLLNTEENGIYKLKLAPENDEEKIPVRLISDKATYLTYHDGYIYYSNSSNKKYLTRISTTPSQEPVSECLMEEAVTYIINNGSDLYFDASNGLASAIYKYSINTKKLTKLTTDSGKYLTIVGNYVYYVNNDLLTSNLFGDGIYRVNINSTNGLLPGEKVLEAEDGDGYSSLTSDGTNLYYYKLKDKHFYRNSTSGTSEKDLMENFALEEKVTLAGYSKLAEYKGEIYYTDPTDDSALYKYNPTTKTNVKVLSDCVSNVYFHNGYMYYSTFILTNYALMRMNLTTNEITKVTSERCDNLIFDGNTIYYVQISGGLFTNKIKSISVDGTNETVIVDGKNQWVYGFEKVGNVFYYVINPSIGYKYIYTYDTTTKTETSLKIKAENFVIANNKIYYYCHTDSNLSVCDLDGKNSKVIKDNLTIETMYLDGNNLYFSSVHASNTGVYKCDISQSAPSASKISSKKANGIVAYNGNVYFLNSSVSFVKDYPVQSTTDCDGKLYCNNETKPIN